MIALCKESWTHRRALHGLVADLNAIGATYPGTNIPVIYRVSRPRQRTDVHQSHAVAQTPMSKGLTCKAYRHIASPSS